MGEKSFCGSTYDCKGENFTCILFWSVFLVSGNFPQQSDMPRNCRSMFIVEAAVSLATEGLKGTSYEHHVCCSSSRTELALMPMWHFSPFYLPEIGTIFIFVYTGSLRNTDFSFVYKYFTEVISAPAAPSFFFICSPLTPGR